MGCDDQLVSVEYFREISGCLCGGNFLGGFVCGTAQGNSPRWEMSELETRLCRNVRIPMRDFTSVIKSWLTHSQRDRQTDSF